MDKNSDIRWPGLLPVFGGKHLLDRASRWKVFGGIVLVGSLMAAAGVITIPIGRGEWAVWPAVTLHIVTPAWFGWVGVVACVVFPFMANTAFVSFPLGFGLVPANLIQGAVPFLLLRLWRVPIHLPNWGSLVRFAGASLVGCFLAGFAATLARAILGDLQSPVEGLRFALAWGVSNTVAAWFLGIPVLRSLSPMLIEVARRRAHAGAGGRTFAGGLAAALSALAIVPLWVVAVLSIPRSSEGLPSSSPLAALVAALMLPLGAFVVARLWRRFAAPVDALEREIRAVRRGREEALAPLPEGTDAELLGLSEAFSDLITQLRRAQDYWRKLFDSVGEPVLLLDEQGRIVQANPAFARVLQIPSEKVAGRNVADLVPDSEHQKLAELWARRLPGRTDVFSLSVWRGDGELRHVRVTAALLQGEDGGVRGTVAVLADVTDVEHLIERAAAAERLEALANLAAGFSHEFNNLLQAFAGQAIALAGGASGPEQAGAINSLVQTGARLTRRLTGMAGIGHYDPAPVDLESLLEEALGELDERLKITLLVSSDLPPVVADRAQLLQAIRVMINNAAEAVVEGGHIDVKVVAGDVGSDVAERAALKPGRYVTVICRDDGPGIAPEDMPHIFEPFFTTRDRACHRGLGLAAARGVARGCGGVLLASSSPGMGASFTLYLPVTRGGVAGPAETTTTEPARQALHALVVDDDPDVAAALATALSALGHTSTIIGSGEEAIRRLTSEPSPDVVLLDLLMPGISGFEVLTSIREQHPRLPVVLSSGYAPDQRVRRELENPATVFLQKPYNVQQLKKTLMTLNEARKSQP